MYRELKVHCENPDCQRVIDDGETYYECQEGFIIKIYCEECFDDYAENAWDDLTRREKADALGCEARIA